MNLEKCPMDGPNIHGTTDELEPHKNCDETETNCNARTTISPRATRRDVALAGGHPVSGSADGGEKSRDKGQPAGARGVGRTGALPASRPQADCSLLGSYRIKVKKEKKINEGNGSKIAEIQKLPWLKPYSRDAFDFMDYLSTTAQIDFRISGMAQTQHGDYEEIHRQFGYPHRFKDNYRKAILSKLYQLDDWWKLNPCAVTMITLTTFHDWRKPYEDKRGYHPAVQVNDGYSIEESFSLLKSGWRSLRYCLYYYLDDFTFVWVLEPHKMGYPHMHLLVFGEVPQRVQDKIRELWIKRYGIAGKAGVDFAIKTVEGDIDSLRNYLMKYISKSLYSDEMSPCEIVYQSMLYKHGYRLWDSSRNLKSIMKYQKPVNDVTWLKTEMVDKNGETKEVWSAQQ